MISMSTKTNKVVCLKWGSKYPAEYVNKLYRSVIRNSNVTEFHCITEDNSSIDKGVICHPLPQIDLEGWWFKPTLFNPNYYQDIQGEVLYLDLDIVITDNINKYFEIERNTDLLAMKDPWFNEINSSVMRWNRSELMWVWEKFLRCTRPYRNKEVYVLDGYVFQGDQNFLNHIIDSKEYFPSGWTLGWKAHGKEAVIEKNPSIVIFNGKPDPHELVDEVKWISDAWQ